MHCNIAMSWRRPLWVRSGKCHSESKGPLSALEQTLPQVHFRPVHERRLGWVVYPGPLDCGRILVPRGGVPWVNQINDLAKSGSVDRPTRSLCFLARVTHRQRDPPTSKSGVPRRVDAVAKAYDPHHASGYQKADLAQRSTNVYATLDAY